MPPEELVRSITVVLERSGFDHSRVSTQTGPVFDLVARKDNLLLLIKAAERREDIWPEQTKELKVLASILKASPLLIISSGPSRNYQDGVLYIKHGLPLMTFNTLFDHLIEEVPPMVYFSSGGHYVSLDGEELRRSREDRGISLGVLADNVGVTRRTIQLYEEGMGVDLEVALRIEAFLDMALIRALDPFRYDQRLQGIRDRLENVGDFQKEVFDHLGSIGMEVIPTTGCPFDALARAREGVVMTSLGRDLSDIRDRGRLLSGITSVSGSDSMMVVNGPVKKRKIGGTPVLNLSEVKGTQDVGQLLRMIRERRRS